MLTTVVTLVYACLCNVALDGVTADSEEKRRSVWHVVGGILYLDVCIHTHTHWHHYGKALPADDNPKRAHKFIYLHYNQQNCGLR